MRTDDPDIYRCAWILVREYGDHAPALATSRANQLASGPETEAQQAWRRIAEAATDLLRTEPLEDESIH